MTPLLFVLAQATQPTVVEHVAVKTTSDTLSQLVAAVVGITITVLSALVSYYLIPWLRAKGAAIDAEIQKNQSQTNLTEEQRKAIMLDRVKRMVFSAALVVADREFPQLAALIQSGSLTNKDDIKAYLHKLGEDLKKEVLANLASTDVDAVQAVGIDTINQLVERAAIAVSPFPGKDTAKALLEGGAADVLKHGVDYIRAQNRTASPGADPLNPTAAAANLAATLPDNGAPASVVVTPAVVAPAVLPVSGNQ